jgi:hypothetical protein
MLFRVLPFPCRYGLLNPESVLLRACMLLRVGKPEMPSVGGASEKRLPKVFLPSGSSRERFRRYTPEKMMRKPQSNDIVFTGDVVLKPWNRRKDAIRVQVVNVT